MRALAIACGAFLVSLTVVLAGCNTTGSRIREHQALFESLPEPTRQNLRDGVIEVDAGSVANDAPFCTKKQELIAYARATVAKDVTRMMELVSGDGTCMVLSSKTEATLLSKHDGGSIVEVRLFKRGKTLEGFAMTEDFVQ